MTSTVYTPVRCPGILKPTRKTKSSLVVSFDDSLLLDRGCCCTIPTLPGHSLSSVPHASHECEKEACLSCSCPYSGTVHGRTSHGLAGDPAPRPRNARSRSFNLMEHADEQETFNSLGSSNRPPRPPSCAERLAGRFLDRSFLFEGQPGNPRYPIYLSLSRPVLVAFIRGR
jgi:hypothetical protein